VGHQCWEHLEAVVYGLTRCTLENMQSCKTSLNGIQLSFLYQVDSNSPATLHKHAKLHASSSHSFAFQEASLVQEVGDMV
jgi:hypothetical protein